MLNLRQGTTLALSSAAPLYSAAVTAPLVVPLVGGGAPLVYLLAMVPMMLVCYGMACNNAALPDKGTVYVWGMKDGHAFGWFGGFSLALTGIMATAGLAYVAIDLLAPDLPVWGKVLVGMLLIGVAQATSLKSVQLTSTVQVLGVVLQVVALGYLAVQALIHGLEFPTIHGSITAWGHAAILAVFAYWGFDSIFALAEESEGAVPRSASFLSIILMFTTYALYAGFVTIPAAESAANHLVVQVAIAVSAFMSLGSTLLPTARGIESMAEHGDLPARLSRPRPAGLFTMALSMAWVIVMLFSPALFNDSIEALSIFVGLYFMLSSWSALNARRGSLALHAASLALMAAIIVLSLIDMLQPDYGTLRVGDVGGVGLLALGLVVIGAVSTVIVVLRARHTHAISHLGGN
jgi:hypothetical protein